MKRAVITTTIYVPNNLVAWAANLREGDLIVVSGDVKTPHDATRSLLDGITEKFGVKTQYVVETNTMTSAAVPMNSIQRRNVATLEAIRAGAELITTVDTDNYPLADHVSYDLDSSHFDEIERLLTTPWTDRVVTSDTRWVNAGVFCSPNVMYRGWPLGIDDDSAGLVAHDKPVSIGVHSSLWRDDPDITALERLLSNPTVIWVPEYAMTLQPGTWCPFNSQATTFHASLAPLLNVWPGVGRVDDIWPSYVAQHIMHHLGYAVAYGAPNVRQERHPHDVVTDLENEIIGYRHTNALIDVIRDVDLSGITNVVDAFEVVIDALGNSSRLADVIPSVTRAFWDAWIDDLRDIYDE